MRIGFPLQSSNIWFLWYIGVPACDRASKTEGKRLLGYEFFYYLFQSPSSCDMLWFIHDLVRRYLKLDREFFSEGGQGFRECAVLSGLEERECWNGKEGRGKRL